MRSEAEVEERVRGQKLSSQNVGSLVVKPEKGPDFYNLTFTTATI